MITRKNKILTIMDQVIEAQTTDEKGIFLMSKRTIKDYRKAVGNYIGIYKGHKVKTLPGVSDEKIYLMSVGDYENLKNNIIAKDTKDNTTN